MGIESDKHKLREKVWSLMEQAGVVRFPLPARGRVPNFEGSGGAAERVRQLPEWQRASVVLSNPDYAQKRVREYALKDGKTLVMASPRLKRGYLKISPESVTGKESFASTIPGAFRYGTPVKIGDMPKPDLIITGCVAVDGDGNRLGKGGGYGDREIGTVQKTFGDIPVITTVHDIQLVDKVPTEKHDTKVNIIVTPTKVYAAGKALE